MKEGSLFKIGNASFLAISSLFSQVLGFLRDKLLSYIYGASIALDSYYASFRVPEFMYLSVGSFVSSAILVPLFAKKLYEPDVKIWFQKLFTTFLVFFIIVYGIVLFVLPEIIKRLYSHTDSNFQHSIVVYGSILLVSTLFLSLSSIISSVAQEKRDFFHVGLAPIMYNLGTVIGILVLRPFWGIVGVCIGVVGGSLMHLLIQMPQVKKMGLFEGYQGFILRAFSVDLLLSTIKKSFLRTLSLAASAIGFFLLTYFASLYPSGSITIIAIAFTLQTISHTLIGVSYATAVLPALSDAFVKGDHALFDGILRRGFKKIFLISFVVTGAVLILRTEIVHILFGGGKFDESSVFMTAMVLGFFTISLYAQNAILLLSRAAYAVGDYTLPLFTNIVASLVLYILAQGAWRSQGTIFHNIWSVPIAYSLAQYVALCVSIYIHRKRKEIPKLYLPFSYIFKILFVILCTTISMGYVGGILFPIAGTIFEHITFSIFIFGSYLLFIYVLLGLVKDDHVQEHRLYLKNRIKNMILALLPNRR